MGRLLGKRREPEPDEVPTGILLLEMLIVAVMASSAISSTWRLGYERGGNGEHALGIRDAWANATPGNLAGAMVAKCDTLDQAQAELADAWQHLKG